MHHGAGGGHDDAGHAAAGAHSVSHGMVFENGRKVTLLFSGFSTENGVPYGVLCFICFLSGFLAVLLKVMRNKMEYRFSQIDSENKAFRLSTINFGRALIVMVVLSWDYFLMLAAMTFNVGIFLSIVGGVAFGFLLMGHLFIATVEERITCCYPQRLDVACQATSQPKHNRLLNSEIGSCCCGGV